MAKVRAMLTVVVLTAVLFPALAASEPSPVPQTGPAAGPPACEASLAQLIFEDLPALPGGPAEPIYAACDWVCTDQCDEYYQECTAGCPGFRGDPCLTECRSGRIACYQSCGCL